LPNGLVKKSSWTHGQRGDWMDIKEEEKEQKKEELEMVHREAHDLDLYVRTQERNFMRLKDQQEERKRAFEHDQEFDEAAIESVIKDIEAEKQKYLDTREMDFQRRREEEQKQREADEILQRQREAEE